jgi:hypothetical protein
MLSPQRNRSFVRRLPQSPLILSGIALAASFSFCASGRADLLVTADSPDLSPTTISGTLGLPSGSYTLGTSAPDVTGGGSSIAYNATTSPTLGAAPSLANTAVNQFISAPATIPTEINGFVTAEVGADHFAAAAGSGSMDATVSSQLTQVVTVKNNDLIGEYVDIAGALSTDDGSFSEISNYTPAAGDPHVLDGSAAVSVQITSNFGYNPAAFGDSFDTGFVYLLPGDQLTITSTASAQASVQADFSLSGAVDTRPAFSRQAFSSFDLFLETTPEPATIGTVVVGGFMLLGRRKQKWARQGRQS